MTFEEAKKILEKEGFVLEKRPGKPHAISEDFIEYEFPKICEAMQVVSSAGYKMLVEAFDARKARLKKEYEKNTKAPGPGEEQPKKGNPALKEAASQFNDALLDEQAKKIAELTKEKTNLEDQITILNACKEHNENFGRKQIKRLGKEISKLNSIIHDKNAVLSDVAEELRLTKIREKNLVEVSQKYMKENEELREKVAEKTKLVEVVRKSYKEYCDYGIAAEKMIQKMVKVIVEERAIDSEDFEQYRCWANGYRFNPQLPEFSEEELMKIQEKVVASCDIAEEGGDHSGKIVLCGKDFVKILKENEKAAEELSKVLDDVID